MNTIRSTMRFLKGERAFALVTALAVFAMVAYAHHIESIGGSYNLMPVSLIAGATAGAMSFARGWFSREREAKIDASHSQTYYQQVRVLNALGVIQMINDMCDHVQDPDHQKCRSACMTQLNVIRAAYGGGPDPVAIHGGKMLSAMSRAAQGRGNVDLYQEGIAEAAATALRQAEDRVPPSSTGGERRAGKERRAGAEDERKEKTGYPPSEYDT